MVAPYHSKLGELLVRQAPTGHVQVGVFYLSMSHLSGVTNFHCQGEFSCQGWETVRCAWLWEQQVEAANREDRMSLGSFTNSFGDKHLL